GGRRPGADGRVVGARIERHRERHRAVALLCDTYADADDLAPAQARAEVEIVRLEERGRQRPRARGGVLLVEVPRRVRVAEPALVLAERRGPDVPDEPLLAAEVIDEHLARGAARVLHREADLVLFPDATGCVHSRVGGELVAHVLPDAPFHVAVMADHADLVVVALEEHALVGLTQALPAINAVDAALSREKARK